MKLKELLESTKIISSSGGLETEISGIAYDSRRVKPGDIFVAIPGTLDDGAKYVPMAIRAGAAAVVYERSAPSQGVTLPFAAVPSARAALADLSCAFFGHPSKKLKVVGITGTNGKTTTAYLVDSIFKNITEHTGLISTIETRVGNERSPSMLTTPESLELQGLFLKMLGSGVTHAVMEVSSHSIALKRVKGVAFDCAVYTNLSHDHLDFHKTLEAYFDTKMKLFRSLGASGKPGVFGAVNIDDKYSEAVMEETDGDVITYSLKGPADVCGDILSQSLGSMKMELRYGRDTIHVDTKLSGRFNAYNILAAAACAKGFGISPDQVRAGIVSLEAVPGRLEFIEKGQPFKVIVDFAHSPDSLDKLLSFLGEFKTGRILLVFGCTGDRDKAKRPVMGAVAAGKADFSVVTSDDPHNEDPLEIIRAVEAGFLRSGKTDGKDYVKVPDRRQAIYKAVGMAAPGDILVIAGRGHEKIQEVKGVKIEIDDRSAAEDAIGEILS